MKRTNRKMRTLALASAGILALYGVGFGSSASAEGPATPKPTISPMPTSGGSEAESSDESDAQAVLSGSQSAESVSSEAPEATEAVEPQEVDTEVEALDAENQAEGDAFGQDVAEAEQSGDQESAVELKDAAAVVTSVTVPEVTAMTADNTEAHAVITGTP